MSVVSLYIGQAGCQGGTALQELLATEAGLQSGGSATALSVGSDWSDAADRFFYLAAAGGKTQPTARAVLLDMEPKSVASALKNSSGSSRAWQYSRGAVFAAQGGGSGNNWAAGALRHAPAVRQQAVGMLRRQVERCDRFGGFLVMQSAAGGTGSGLGSAMTEILREEFPACRILHHCIWPFECGETAVQPYNCLLTLASLAQHSSGVVLTQNEVLAETCRRQLGIERPQFSHLNAVAARALASLLLPCTLQQAPSVAAAAGPEGGGSGRGRGGGQRGHRPEWDAGAVAAQSAPAPKTAAAAAWDGTFGSGSRWSDDEEERGGRGHGRGGPGSMLDPMADICDRLCSWPGYRLLSLRNCPQLPPTSFDFTPFSWPVVLKDLRDMQLAGRALEAGLAAASGSSGSGGGSSGWASSASSSQRLSRGGSGSSSSLPWSGSSSGTGRRLGCNKTLANLLVLRGDGASSADAASFADPALYSRGSSSSGAAQQLPLRMAAPLAVAATSARLGKQQMLATLLSNDQVAAVPVSRMLGRAAQLYESRAYVHHYERFGLACSDFEEAFEQVEGIVERYAALG